MRPLTESESKSLVSLTIIANVIGMVSLLHDIWDM